MSDNPCQRVYGEGWHIPTASEWPYVAPPRGEYLRAWAIDVRGQLVAFEYNPRDRQSVIEEPRRGSLPGRQSWYNPTDVIDAPRRGSLPASQFEQESLYCIKKQAVFAEDPPTLERAEACGLQLGVPRPLVALAFEVIELCEQDRARLKALRLAIKDRCTVDELHLAGQYYGSRLERLKKGVLVFDYRRALLDDLSKIACTWHTNDERECERDTTGCTCFDRSLAFMAQCRNKDLWDFHSALVHERRMVIERLHEISALEPILQEADRCLKDWRGPKQKPDVIDPRLGSLLDEMKTLGNRPSPPMSSQWRSCAIDDFECNLSRVYDTWPCPTPERPASQEVEKAKPAPSLVPRKSKPKKPVPKAGPRSKCAPGDLICEMNAAAGHKRD